MSFRVMVIAAPRLTEQGPGYLVNICICYPQLLCLCLAS